MFPWLSQLATNYEQFSFKGLLFEYKTMSGNALTSTNTALGTVILATQYNTNDTPFTSKIEMEQYEFAQSVVPSCSIIHPVECAPSETVLSKLYISNPGSTVPGDPRFSNLGTFNLATSGMQAAAVVGELWVTYHVTFLKPRLAPQEYYWHATSNTVSGSYYAAALNLIYGEPSSFSVDPTSSIAIIPSGTTPNLLTFPQGYAGVYFFIISVIGSGGVPSGWAITYTGDLAPSYYFGRSFNQISANSPLPQSVSPTPSSSNSNNTYIAVFSSTGLGGTINFIPSFGGYNVAYCDLIITRVAAP
jgi:hypothetical protein